MTDTLLVLIRDPQVVEVLLELGLKLTSSSQSKHVGLICTKVVPDWPGFLALTPSPTALPDDAKHQSRDETILIPMSAVLMAAHLASRRIIGFHGPALTAG